MKNSSIVSIVTLAACGAGTTLSAAQIFVVAPVAIVAPAAVRALTNKKAEVPACSWQVVTAKPNNFVCAKTDIDWQSYGRLEIAPVEVAPSNLKKDLSERQTEQLRDALTTSLHRRFQQMEGAETGRTLVLRATVTNVELSNRAVNIVSLAAIQAPLSFGGATARIQLLDRDSGEPLAEMTVRGRGRAYDFIPSVQAVGHARKALTRAPKQLGKNLDALRAKFGPEQIATLAAGGGER
jgi:Protein of unknown function (DUF3313)